MTDGGRAGEFDAITVEALRVRGGLKWGGDADLLPAWVAEADFGTAPAVLDAVRAGVEAMTFGYSSATMIGDMTAACADWLARQYGWTVPAARIHAVGDVLHGLELVLDALCPPGTPLVLPTPGYMPFLVVPPSIGHDVVQVPGLRAGDGRWSLDLDALDRALERTDSALLVLCNPWNPVGSVLRLDELQALCDLVERHPGTRVFADEIHGPLVYPGHRHVPYASVSELAAQHSVSALSASKAWNLPGLKTAQLILTSDQDQERWPAADFRATKAASNLGLLAATAAFRHGQPWLDDVVAYLDGSRRLLRQLLAEELPGVAYRAPEGTYLAWLDCRALGLGEAPAAFFRREGRVALVEGTACGRAGSGFVRLNFATPRPVLRRVVQRLGAAVRA